MDNNSPGQVNCFSFYIIIMEIETVIPQNKFFYSLTIEVSPSESFHTMQCQQVTIC